MNEEEELQKALEEENKRAQEEYDEITKGNKVIREKQKGDQQLEIPGLFESADQPRSGVRRGASLAFEIGANTLVDPLSVFDPTGASQYAAGSLINYIAQRIRGGEISAGEMTAAGLASLIPGGAQGTALVRFGKGALKGATSGAIESTSIAAIDEGRLPTAGEFAASTGFGAAFGGALSTPQGRKAFKEVVKKVDDVNYDLSGGLLRAGLRKNNPLIAQGAGAIPPPRQSSTPGSGGGGGGRRITVGIDGKQGELFDTRDYTEYKTLGDELLARSEGVVPDPTAPNYRQLQKINQQVFRNIQSRIAVEKGINPEDAFYSVVAQNPNFSFVEHLTAKGGYMDWYWDLLSGLDRNASDNVRLLLNDPFKQLKDVVENFGYGTAANNYSGPFLRGNNLSKRLVVDVEMPKQLLSKQGIPAIAQNEPGNIVIREAGKMVNGKFKKGRVIGKFGDYLDVLFRDESEVIAGLLEQARQGRPALLKRTDRYGRRLAVTNSELRGPEGRARRQQLSDAVVRARFKEWRKEFIEERIQEILNKRASKLKLSNTKAIQRIDKRILEDMEQIRADYPFLGGRARAVEQAKIDADPELATSALLTDRPKSSKIARDADPRTRTTRSGGNRNLIKVKFKNGRTGEVIRRIDRNGNTTYYRKNNPREEIFSEEFTEIKPSQNKQQEFNI